jgi:hypothetical protein
MIIQTSHVLPWWSWVKTQLLEIQTEKWKKFPGRQEVLAEVRNKNVSVCTQYSVDIEC